MSTIENDQIVEQAIQDCVDEVNDIITAAHQKLINMGLSDYDKSLSFEKNVLGELGYTK